MVQAVHIRRCFFENLIEHDLYTFDSITDPVVLDCNNAKERMEKIWKELLKRQQGNPQDGNNTPINMAYICVFDRNQSTERGVMDRIRQGEGVLCPRRCQGVGAMVNKVYHWDLLQELYVKDKYSQDDFIVSTGKIECVAQCVGVELMQSIAAGNIERVREVCEGAAVDVNYTDKDGWTVLMSASRSGHVDRKATYRTWCRGRSCR